MAGAPNETQPTRSSVTAFLDAIEDPDRRRDCKAIARIMKRVSGQRPTMWGSIVGYGKYHYRYDSGREGDFFRTGFSPRKRNITIYILPGYSDFSSILARLGKHQTGKSCLYIKRLSDIEVDVLEELVQAGWDDMARRYPE